MNPTESQSFVEVDLWLQGLGLAQYLQAFKDHHIDAWVLPLLVDVDLEAIGVLSVGHRKRLLWAIAQRVAAKEPAPIVAPAGATRPASQVGLPAPAQAPGAATRRLKIFLSYGRDAYVTEVRALKDALEARGHELWFDQEQLGVGLDWERRIEDGLAWCDRVVLTMTPHAVRRPDGYCLNELAKALERQKVIIPVLLTDVPNGVPTSICRIQYLDWRDAVPAAEKPERFAARMARLAEAIEQDKLDFEGGQQRLLRVLQPLNYAGDIERHIARFQGRKALFMRLRQWLDDPHGSQLVWLCGGSGLGKSAIVAMMAHQWGEAGAVHFCVAGHVDKADPRRAILSIAFQLSTHLDAYRSRLMALDLELEIEKSPYALFDAVLVGPLTGDFPTQSHPWLVVIDALDEATRADGQNELAELVGQYWRKLPSWLRLAVSSQPDGEIQTWLSDVTPIMFSGEDVEQLADLRAYLQRELQAQGREVAEAVVDRILERSEGAFQYVVLLLEEIRQGRCNPEDEVELPRGMQAAYLQSFKRRFPDLDAYQTQCRPLLELILASPDPVPLALLAQAVGTSPLEVRRRLANVGSMVSLHPAEGSRDADWDCVRFTQSSLRRWLTGIDERTRLSMAGAFAVDAGQGVLRLAAETLRAWDLRQKKAAAGVPSFVAAHVFGLLAQAGDSPAQDRIALEVSQYWAKASLSRALLPAVHAARWADEVAAQAGAGPDILARAGGSHHQLGQVLQGRGDGLGALAEYRAAQRLWERLAHEQPEDMAARQALGEVHAKLAEVIRAQGNLEGALAEQRRALAVAEDLVAREPENPGLRCFLGTRLDQLGNTLRRQGGLQEALNTHRRALAVREALVTADPGNALYQRNVSASHNNIGIALKTQGDLRGTLVEYQKQRAILQRLNELEPNAANLQWDLSISHFNLSLLLDDMGQIDEASQEILRCVVLREKLVRVDPDNAGYLAGLIKAYGRSGSIKKSQGDLDGALAEYELCRQFNARLAAQDPSNGEWQQDLASACSQIGGLYEAKGQLRLSLDELRRGLAIRERLMQQDPANPDWKDRLGDIASQISDVLQELGELEEALELASRVLLIRMELVRRSPGNTVWQQALALSHHRLAKLQRRQGLLDDAQSHAQEALTLSASLAQKDPQNAKWQNRLAKSHELLGSIWLECGNLDRAQAAFGQALAIIDALLTKDPRHAGWLDLISDLHAEMGWILECQGSLDEALLRYREDLRISRELVLQGGTKVGWQRDFGLAHLNIGRLNLRQQQPADGLEHLQHALRILGQLADPLRPGSLIDHAGALALTGQAHRDLGQAEQAREHDHALAVIAWHAHAADRPERRQFLGVIVRRLEACLDQLPDALRSAARRRCEEAALALRAFDGGLAR